jgi:hypothetical protein
MTGESSRKRVMYTHSMRALLLAEERTAGELARFLGLTTSYVTGILQTEYGFYIDRWATTEKNLDAAVWGCVVVPEHCPRPDRKTLEIEK